MNGEKTGGERAPQEENLTELLQIRRDKLKSL